MHANAPSSDRLRILSPQHGTSSVSGVHELRTPDRSYDAGVVERIEGEGQRMRDRARKVLDLELWNGTGLEPHMRVLDLGCGPGVVSCALAEVVDSGSVVGIDRCPAMLAQAQRSQELSGARNVSFRQMEAAALDFPEQSFDYVWAQRVFQHLPEPEQVLTAVSRVLAPGGRLAVADVDKELWWLEPHSEAVDEFFALVREGQQRAGGDARVGRKLAPMLIRAGFQDVRARVEVVVGDAAEIRRFADNLIFTVAELYAPQARRLAEQAHADMLCLAERPDSRLYWNYFVASGEKPKSM